MSDVVGGFDFDTLHIDKVLCGRDNRSAWRGNHWGITIKNGEEEMHTDFYIGLGHDKAVPKNSAIMWSLFDDAQALQSNIIDWCDGTGMSYKDVVAISQYIKCCEVGKELHRLYSLDLYNRMQTALRDY